MSFYQSVSGRICLHLECDFSLPWGCCFSRVFIFYACVLRYTGGLAPHKLLYRLCCETACLLCVLDQSELISPFSRCPPSLRISQAWASGWWAWMQGFNCLVTFSIATVTCGPWFGQVNCKLGLPSSFCQSCAERRRWPTPGRHLVQTATRLSPARNHPFPSQTHGEGNDESPAHYCVYSCPLAAALSVSHQLVSPSHSSLAVHSVVHTALLYSPAVYIKTNVSQILKCVKSDLFFSKKPPT